MRTYKQNTGGKYLKSMLTLVGLFAAFLSSSLQGSEITFTFDNALGSAEYLLGSKLVPDASYGSSMFTLSAVLSDRTRAYVDLSHTQIYPYEDYSSTNGEIGLQLRYLDIKDNQIFAGLYSFMSRYRDNYSYYNSNGMGLYMKWKHYFKASQLIIAGYDLNFNRFEEVSEASNTDHELHFTYNQSFKTRTSINYRNSIAYQNFWPQTVLEETGRFVRTVEVDQIPDNSLFESELRVSQSLGPKLGLTWWLYYQTLLSNEAGGLVLTDAMDNPFIDRFRWEGPSTSLRLMYRMSPRNSLKASYSMREKNYLNVPVYAYDFENQNYVLVDDAYVDLGMERADNNRNVQVYWNVNLDRSLSNWVPGLELVLNAGMTINSSNDLIYDYESMNYGITLNINN